ncbi:MAG TPA: DUF4234 domain-containing protein [Acidimicrobiales bacterium]
MSDPTNADGVPEPEATPPPVTPAPTPDFSAPPAVTPPIAPLGVRTVGKTRNPWGVWGLSIITLGIYYLYWYYKINSEVRDYDKSIEVDPAIATVAQFIPIASLISFWNCGGRINRTQQTAGSSERCSQLAGLLLMVFVLGTGIVYYQSQLNKVWDLHGNPEPGTAV